MKEKTALMLLPTENEKKKCFVTISISKRLEKRQLPHFVTFIKGNPILKKPEKYLLLKYVDRYVFWKQETSV